MSQFETPRPDTASRATIRPAGFTKPAHWTNDPLPEPAAPQPAEALGPTRYGDWVNKGIVAVDF